MEDDDFQINTPSDLGRSLQHIASIRSKLMLNFVVENKLHFSIQDFG